MRCKHTVRDLRNRDLQALLGTVSLRDVPVITRAEDVAGVAGVAGVVGVVGDRVYLLRILRSRRLMAW